MALNRFLSVESNRNQIGLQRTAVCTSRHRLVATVAAMSEKGNRFTCQWRHAVRAHNFMTFINCRESEGRTLGDPRGDVVPAWPPVSRTHGSNVCGDNAAAIPGIPREAIVQSA